LSEFGVQPLLAPLNEEDDYGQKNAYLQIHSLFVILTEWCEIDGSLY